MSVPAADHTHQPTPIPQKAYMPPAPSLPYLCRVLQLGDLPAGCIHHETLLPEVKAQLFVLDYALTLWWRGKVANRHMVYQSARLTWLMRLTQMD